MATLQNKNVLITGGAGFIGSHLSDALTGKNPAKIFVMDNFFLGKKENLSTAVKAFSNFQIVEQDATDFEALKKFFEKNQIDVVFDLATIPLPASLEKPYWSSKVIYDLALNLCELSRLQYFKTLIHCSSSEAYGSAVYAPMDENHPLKTETPYAAAKAAAALLVDAYHRTFKIDMAIARPFNNFGPRQNGRDFAGIVPLMIKRIRSGKTPVIFGDGLQTRDYLYAADTAQGLIKLYECEKARGQTVNLASGKEVSVLKIVEDISRLMDWKTPPEFAPPRPGDVRRHCAGTKLATELFDFTPTVNWSEGIETTVKWYQENPERLN